MTALHAARLGAVPEDRLPDAPIERVSGTRPDSSSGHAPRHRPFAGFAYREGRDGEDMSKVFLHDKILGSDWKTWDAWIDKNLQKLSDDEREWFGSWDNEETMLRDAGVCGVTGAVGSNISESEISARRVSHRHGWVAARSKELPPTPARLFDDGLHDE